MVKEAMDKQPENSPRYSVEEHIDSQLVMLNKRIGYQNAVLTVVGAIMVLAILVYGYFLFFAPIPAGLE